MFSYFLSYLTWAFTMSPTPYKQAPLSLPEFTKHCLCPEGGPKGTRRCRNKSYCGLVRNKGEGLVEEAEELAAELVDDWQLLNDVELRVKAYRLAELRCCDKDNRAGRNVEVGEKLLAQRRDEEGRRQPRANSVPAVPLGRSAPRPTPNASSSRPERHPAKRGDILAMPKRSAGQAAPDTQSVLRQHLSRQAEAPSTSKDQTLATFLDRLPSPPTFTPIFRPQTKPPQPPVASSSNRGRLASKRPPPPSRSTTATSSRTLREVPDFRTEVSLANRVKQLEAHVQTLQAQLKRSERETGKWWRKYQGLRTLYDRIANLVRQDDEEENDEED
ncbi:hypothetical protein LTR85_005908 [Meristemomyces frigidus]|nr:hypothetical protein LTR85_005908 [Meristemomyces frigidus]